MNYLHVQSGCELCEQVGGTLLWQDDFLRVIWVADESFSAFIRVVVRAHVAEMTDLPPESRSRLMSTVCFVEQVMREVLRPTKVNLASLGNKTPHLHWHVIPRFADDANFPEPIWAPIASPRASLSADVVEAFINTLKIALYSRT